MGADNIHRKNSHGGLLSERRWDKHTAPEECRKLKTARRRKRRSEASRSVVEPTAQSRQALCQSANARPQGTAATCAVCLVTGESIAL